MASPRTLPATVFTVSVIRAPTGRAATAGLQRVRLHHAGPQPSLLSVWIGDDRTVPFSYFPCWVMDLSMGKRSWQRLDAFGGWRVQPRGAVVASSWPAPCRHNSRPATKDRSTGPESTAQGGAAPRWPWTAPTYGPHGSLPIPNQASRLVRDSCTNEVALVTAVSISNARENLFPLVRQVSEDHVVIEIVARNGGNAVLMSAEDYESLQETLYLFSTRANAAHLLRGLAEARENTAEPTDPEQLAARFEGQPTR